MKFDIDSETLGHALYRIQGIADKKSTMPILAHVLLEVSSETGLRVSATDLDVGLTGSYEARVEEPGAIAVNARQIYEIVKVLPREDVHIEREDNNWLTLKCGASSFRLVGMPADEFPALSDHTAIATFELPSEDLVRLIERTLFCVSTDDNRHNLSGIYCEARNEKTLRLVSTDGHRLAMAEKTYEQALPIEKGVIVPRKGFQELKRVLGDQGDKTSSVQLGFSENSGVLKAGNVILTTRLVEGQFPEYEQVIPQGGTKHVKIAKSALGEALRRVSLLSQSRAYGVKLELEEDKLKLVAEDPESGTAQETLAVEYQGESLTVGFNARYILDVLSLVQDTGVVLTLTDHLSPGILKPLEEAGFLAVVMPMRI